MCSAGDIFGVCSDWMGDIAKEAGVLLIRPLWGIPRQDLLNSIWSFGISALISCVNVKNFSKENNQLESAPPHSGDSNQSDPLQSTDNATTITDVSIDPVRDVLGQIITPDLHRDVLIPANQIYGIDECGETGEFHTICLDACTFASRLELEYTKDAADGAEYAYLIVSKVSAHQK